MTWEDCPPRFPKNVFSDRQLCSTTQSFPQLPQHIQRLTHCHCPVHRLKAHTAKLRDFSQIICWLLKFLMLPGWAVPAQHMVLASKEASEEQPDTTSHLLSYGTADSKTSFMVIAKGASNWGRADFSPPTTLNNVEQNVITSKRPNSFSSNPY